ncbi:hypothetical protein D3C74_456220 [compost metagenome]
MLEVCRDDVHMTIGIRRNDNFRLLAATVKWNDLFPTRHHATGKLHDLPGRTIAPGQLNYLCIVWTVQVSQRSCSTKD